MLPTIIDRMNGWKFVRTSVNRDWFNLWVLTSSGWMKSAGGPLDYCYRHLRKVVG